MTQLEFAVAGEGVRITSQDSNLLNRVRRAWLPAATLPSGPIVHEVRIDDNGRLWANGAQKRYPDQAMDILVQLQAYLVVETLHYRSHCLHLHAACFRLNGRPLLLVGDSGAGKSSMTRQALRRGASYLTDDCVIVARDQCFGVGRSLQFAHDFVGKPLPAYLSDCDAETFHFTAEGRVYYIPLWAPGFETLPFVSLDDRPWIVVGLEREKSGPNRIRKLDSVERLSLIHGAVISSGQEYRGELGYGPTYALTWNDPEVAFGLLVDELDRGAALGAGSGQPEPERNFRER